MKLHFRILGILTLFVVLALGAPVAEAQSTTSSSGTASSSFFFWADPPEVGVTDPESTVTLRWYVGVSDQISCTASGFTATITPNSSMTPGSAVVTPPRDTSATYRITCTDFQGTYSKSITMQQNPNFYQPVPTPDYSQIPIGVINLGGISIPNFGVSLTSAIQATGPQIYSKTREGIIYGDANYSYTIPDLGSCAGDAIAAGLSADSTYYCLEDSVISTPTPPVCWMFCTGGQTGGGPQPSFSGGSINGSYKVTRYFYETAPQVIPWTYPTEPAYASATCTSPSTCTIYQHVPPQVPPPSVPPTVTLTASPTSIVRGNASALTWSATDADSCTATGFSVGSALSGTASVSPTTTTTYNVTCTGTGGSTTASATVTVTAPPAPTISFTASPTSVMTGAASSLSWVSTNATSCSINSGIGSVATSGTRSVSPTTTTTYTITCTGTGGTTTASATVTVTPVTAPTATLSASPTSITTGGSSTLTWSSTGATTCSLSSGIGSVATSGTRSVSPTTTTTYTITCTGTGGTTTASATVTVTTGLQANLEAGTVTPTIASSGTVTILSASVTNTGRASTVTGFTNLFQIDSDADHAAVTTVQTDTSPALTPGVNDTVTTAYNFATAGTWYVRACADANGAWTGTITESNELDNCGLWTSITVTAPTPRPDLTAGNVTPTTATLNQATTLSAVVTNAGGGSTGRSFNNLFQIDNDADHAVVTSTRTDTSPTLGAGAADTTTISHTFTTAGTWYVRVCADNNETWVGLVTEANENNNCAGQWTTLVVAPSATATLSASPTSITTGGSSTLTWSSTGATTCSLSSGIGSVATSGTRSVSPTTTTTYTITCTGTGGTTTASATVTVTGPQADLTASTVTPTSAVSGTAVSLSGNVTNSGSATANSFTSAIEILNGSRLTTSNITVPAGQVRTTAVSHTFTTAGSYQVRLCADYAGIVPESNENNNCGAWNTITVTAPPVTPRPDLTTGVVTPTTATVGIAASFSADITNSGTLNAGASTASIWIQNAEGVVVRSANISTPAVVVGANRTVSSSYTFTTAGSYNVRVCADNNTSWIGTITELDETNNCGAWATVTVTGPSQPNLTAGSVTPITTTQNQATSLSATISNIGLASAGRAFTNLFQIDNDADHAVVTTTRTDTSPNIGAGSTDVSTVSYTFTTAGLWYVRACADNNAAWTGVVTESDELDNCGLWTAVTVASIQPTVTLSANPASIISGNSAQLYWSSTNVTSCTGTGFSTGGATQGTTGVSVSPLTTSTYQIDCTGPNGSAFSQATVTVVVPAVDIVVDDERVTSGGGTTIHWTSTDTTACSVTGPNSFLQTGTSGSVGITVTAQGTYTASCTTAGGTTVTDSVIVNVLPKFEEF